MVKFEDIVFYPPEGDPIPFDKAVETYVRENYTLTRTMNKQSLYSVVYTYFCVRLNCKTTPPGEADSVAKVVTVTEDKTTGSETMNTRHVCSEGLTINEDTSLLLYFLRTARDAKAQEEKEENYENDEKEEKVAKEEKVPKEVQGNVGSMVITDSPGSIIKVNIQEGEDEIKRLKSTQQYKEGIRLKEQHQKWPREIFLIFHEIRLIEAHNEILKNQYRLIHGM